MKKGNCKSSLKYQWKTIACGLILSVTGFASAVHATFSLPADRGITWQGNVGIPGDIPGRSTVYTTLSPSGGDDSSALKTAISNCPAGQVVKLNAGTFNVSSAINVKSGITLRGAGMGSTIIHGNSGLSGSYVLGISGGPSFGTSYTITNGLTKGSTTITTSSAHGWSAGDLILIDQLNISSGDPVVTSAGTNGTCTWCGRGSGTRSLGQVAKVVAVPSSTTATLEVPTYWNYQASLTPQATKISGISSNAGIENLSVDNETSSLGTAMYMYGANNCWLLNVEIIGSYTNSLLVQRSYRNLIRGCKLHEGTPALPATGTQYGTSRAYGIYLNTASGNLIENSQFYHLDMATKFDGPVSGNVVAYNYVSQMYYSPSASWQVDTFRIHGAHPIMNLFEGNLLTGRAIADFVWGSSSHNTYFRNRNTLDTTRTASAYNYVMFQNASYYNVVGNVIGTTGFENAYQVTTSSSSKAIYGIDSSVSTTLQHGNYDTINNGVVWSGSYDHTLPPSLYLASKPAWWGGVQWPAIGPDVSPMSPTPPTIGSGTPWGSSKVAVSAPTGLKAQ